VHSSSKKKKVMEKADKAARVIWQSRAGGSREHLLPGDVRTPRAAARPAGVPQGDEEPCSSGG